MVNRPPPPTRREDFYWWVRRALPPRGSDRVGLAGVGVVLLVLLLVTAGLAVAVGRAQVIPGLLAVAGLVYGLFVAYDIFGGL